MNSPPSGPRRTPAPGAPSIPAAETLPAAVVSRFDEETYRPPRIYSADIVAARRLDTPTPQRPGVVQPGPPLIRTIEQSTLFDARFTGRRHCP
ncbi:hypothetical protein ACIBM3_29350 [Rhodococcus erythropolis]|uniref:hypothetical protein n=1 Tax=Rhodococcus erythropolis TaxID=1833 RepID=UPI0037A3863F